ncbi:hypothetical protein [Pelomonas sp. Root1444]|uniref:hypothetical protein n=1 Tax=Pelomonas sp. Root1444 TaxID=1736464 RepID=UPI000702CBB6|nr:hypothetical protein [Pelomonas sp. Root1444]KQY81866.1 hypothetical protein ASD35_08785 [Pelomonas sp. Root1444]
MPTTPDSFPATQPIDPPTSARRRLLSGTDRTVARPVAQAAVPRAAERPLAPTPAAAEGLPRWAKGVVAGGVALALAMPATVLLSRSMLVQEVLMQESSSKAAMVCTGGEARAVDGSSLTGWLFSGSYFSCGDWETREARQQRERDLAHNNYMARERSRQGLPPN